MLMRPPRAALPSCARVTNAWDRTAKPGAWLFLAGGLGLLFGGGPGRGLLCGGLAACGPGCGRFAGGLLLAAENVLPVLPELRRRSGTNNGSAGGHLRLLPSTST